MQGIKHIKVFVLALYERKLVVPGHKGIVLEWHRPIGAGIGPELVHSVVCILGSYPEEGSEFFFGAWLFPHFGTNQ